MSIPVKIIIIIEHVNYVNKSYYPSSINNVTAISNVTGSELSHKIFATVLVEGRSQRFEVDSGSKYTLISQCAFDKIGLSNKIEPADVIFVSYLAE